MYADAMTMVNNVLQTIPELTMLVTAFAYVMGMVFVVKGVMDLKTVAISAASSSGGGDGKATLGHCLLFLVVGACLLYLPSAIYVVTSTFWNNASPLAYDTDNSPFSLLLLSIILFPILGWLSIIPAVWAGVATASAAITSCIVCCSFDFFMINLTEFLYRQFYREQIRQGITRITIIDKPSIHSLLSLDKTQLNQNNVTKHINSDSISELHNAEENKPQKKQSQTTELLTGESSECYKHKP